ncbi:hypothetical protein KSP40_PGU016973 [Platanthera guangdongensis]|uniref:Uncharacterized protein n=1 Tax=Platanthera guangdongensis TaxID=2320717 RepID=A0ABR2M6N8_9ASPA
MTKKRAGPPAVTVPIRRHPWLGIQLVASLSALAFLLTLLWIQFYTPNPPLLTPLRFRDPIPFSGKPKIAFLFLTRAGMPLDFVWHAFFKSRKFLCLCPLKAGFKLDRSTTSSPFFYGRHIEDSVQVIWGESSMIEAERLLLSVALDDPANQRFVLLSDSFFDKKERRYNEKMAPSIPRRKWRKGSQWITLIRRHAEVIVDDDAIFPIFKQYCKNLSEMHIMDQEIAEFFPMHEACKLALETLLCSDIIPPHQPEAPLPIQKLPPFARSFLMKPARKKLQSCIPDEHYVPTLLSMRELEDKLERRTLTYTLWNSSKSSWHPVTFKYGNASPQDISKIKVISCYPPPPPPTLAKPPAAPFPKTLHGGGTVTAP